MAYTPSLMVTSTFGLRKRLQFLQCCVEYSYTVSTPYSAAESVQSNQRIMHISSSSSKFIHSMLTHLEDPKVSKMSTLSTLSEVHMWLTKC